MFSTPPRPLKDLTTPELEQLRQEWKKLAETKLFDLLEPLSIGWKCVTREERTRRFYDLSSGEMIIRCYLGITRYSAKEDAFLQYMNLEIIVQGERVANLTYDYVSKKFKEGEWRSEFYHFARPGHMDWLGEIDNLLDEWKLQLSRNAKDSEKVQHAELVKLLSKGLFLHEKEN